MKISPLRSCPYCLPGPQCAAALEVQKIIAEENLLANCLAQGEYLKQLLQDRLCVRTSPAAPFVFDIRGSGGFWGIEFDIPPEKDFTRNLKLKKRFGAMLQAKTMEKGLICIAMDGGADGTRGSHAIVSLNGPAVRLYHQR